MGFKSCLTAYWNLSTIIKNFYHVNIHEIVPEFVVVQFVPISFISGQNYTTLYHSNLLYSFWNLKSFEFRSAATSEKDCNFTNLKPLHKREMEIKDKESKEEKATQVSLNIIIIGFKAVW